MTAITDRFAHLTDAQRRAIATHDRSILVSAAAGSGKTTVLAERCAVLVCDLPASQRCRIDELLVVTFTEAAAGEMKSRIAKAIRQRLDERPDDRWLREQLWLIDAASISTIHAFCRTVIQRWFPQARIDPQASVLSGEEAQLLREEVLDAVLTERYAGDDESAIAFMRLVDDYGAGEDASIRRTILGLHDYISSLAEPEAWLTAAIERFDESNPASLLHRVDTIQRDRLARELALLIEYADDAIATIQRCWPVAAMHADGVAEHRAMLAEWLDALQKSKLPRAWETIAADIGGFEFERAKSKPRNISESDSACFDAAKGLRDETKKHFCKRLQEYCCRFSRDEYLEGLRHVGPYAITLVELVRAFASRYEESKSQQGVVDFNDLQRGAMRVLSPDGVTPSEVARQLQQQYRHVLVDEFQDVDPLQERILRLVSRELAEPPEGNLFAVGDIKQSIYRFRLAEPALFSARADAFAMCDAQVKKGKPPVPPGGELIPLSENFRSRAAVIDAINALFAPLMTREFGGSDYDGRAALVAAATFARASGKTPMFERPAIELHVLEPVTQQTASHDDHSDNGDTSGGEEQEELEGIEREAWLIGTRIQHWMGYDCGARWHVSGRPERAGGEPVGRPLEYRDIVILLRSLPHKAAPIADILRRMGIPVRVDRDEAPLEGAEFNDVLSLLQVLDNRRQDIPLAAVLRSPILCSGRAPYPPTNGGTAHAGAFDENELVRMRLLDKGMPFHACVERYAVAGDDADLRTRLVQTLATLDRYRRRIQQAPVAEVLWEILTQTHYLHYVRGLPDGRRRYDTLLRLHDLARQFGEFSRQGLRRFLRFVEEMVERETLPLGAAGAADEDVVRIMTIHASKGLEFPVVVLADLQKSFNLSDVRSTVLLDRELGIALRATDPQRLITYPTLIHQLAAQQGTHASLSEELRVLYVALTRAREHLMLVGRSKLETVDLQRNLQAAAGGVSRRVPRLELETAGCVLDWILPALSTLPRQQVQWPGEKSKAALVQVETYPRSVTDTWQVPPPVQAERVASLEAIARLEPLPADEPAAPTPLARDLLATLGDRYAALELTTVPARVSVSELKRRWDPQRDPLERAQSGLERTPGARNRRSAAAITYLQPRRLIDPTPADSVRRGTATHRFLQLLDLQHVAGEADLREQLDAFAREGRMSRTEADAVLIEPCAWFFTTPLGARVRNAARTIRRETAFVSRVDVSCYDSLLAGRDERDVILIRGMVDLILDEPDHLEIVDYKTDAVSGDALERRARDYLPQIDSYAAALQGIYQRPVTHRWLVFLHARLVHECPRT